MLASRNHLGEAEGFVAQLRQARVIRLMQAATDPSLLKKPLSHFLGTEDEFSETVYQFDDDLMHTIASYDGTEIPSKYYAAGSLVKKLVDANKKVVVWACFVDTIMHFQSYLGTLGIVSEILYGGTPIESEKERGEERTRERIVEEFHKDNGNFSVIIANPHAVSESISLHKASHDAIYLERSFNAAHYVQSKDRIHRYGLKPNIETSYHYFLSAGSIDETIHERLIEKESRMNEIMEKSPIPLFDNLIDNMGDEDIRRLIQDYVRRTKSTF